MKQIETTDGHFFATMLYKNNKSNFHIISDMSIKWDYWDYGFIFHMLAKTIFNNFTKE